MLSTVFSQPVEKGKKGKFDGMPVCQFCEYRECGRLIRKNGLPEIQVAVTTPVTFYLVLMENAGADDITIFFRVS